MQNVSGMLLQNHISEFAERVCAFLVDLGWYPSGWFFVYLSLTRYCSLRRRNVTQATLLSVKMRWFSVIFVWTICTCSAGSYLFTTEPTNYIGN